MTAGNSVSRQDLMRYLDGELPPEERKRIDEALAISPELRSEMATFRSLKAEFHGLAFRSPDSAGSVWDRVSHTVARPVGWALLLVGVVAWLVYGVHVFTNSEGDPWERLAIGGVAIGILFLLGAMIWNRVRTWSGDPYP